MSEGPVEAGQQGSPGTRSISDALREIPLHDMGRVRGTSRPGGVQRQEQGAPSITDAFGQLPRDVVGRAGGVSRPAGIERQEPGADSITEALRGEGRGEIAVPRGWENSPMRIRQEAVRNANNGTGIPGLYQEVPLEGNEDQDFLALTDRLREHRGLEPLTGEQRAIIGDINTVTQLRRREDYVRLFALEIDNLERRGVTVTRRISPDGTPAFDVTSANGRIVQLPLQEFLTTLQPRNVRRAPIAALFGKIYCRTDSRSSEYFMPAPPKDFQVTKTARYIIRPPVPIWERDDRGRWYRNPDATPAYDRSTRPPRYTADPRYHMGEHATDGAGLFAIAAASAATPDRQADVYHNLASQTLAIYEEHPDLFGQLLDAQGAVMDGSSLDHLIHSDHTDSGRLRSADRLVLAYTDGNFDRAATLDLWRSRIGELRTLINEENPALSRNHILWLDMLSHGVSVDGMMRRMSGRRSGTWNAAARRAIRRGQRAVVRGAGEAAQIVGNEVMPPRFDKMLETAQQFGVPEGEETASRRAIRRMRSATVRLAGNTTRRLRREQNQQQDPEEQSDD